MNWIEPSWPFATYLWLGTIEVDPKEQRKQMNQRFVAGKFLEGESFERIADGMLDPVEEMNYLTDSPRRASQADGESPSDELFLFWCKIAVGALVLLWLNWLLRALCM